MSGLEHLGKEIREHLTAVSGLEAALEETFDRVVAACVAALRGRGKIVLFGNGGSAADAQHIATELTVRYRNDRPALAAIALTTDTSALTAIGNDFGFDDLFARQVEALVGTGDVVIGISTSGRSPNVLKALDEARARGAVTVGLTGARGEGMAERADLVLAVPSEVTARIQEMHILVGHTLCGAIESELGFE